MVLKPASPLLTLLVLVGGCSDNGTPTDLGPGPEMSVEAGPDGPGPDIDTAGCEVVTKSGPVSGVNQNDASCAFKGIPYAKPPTDDLRWMPPQKPDAWKSFLAGSYGDACPQPTPKWKGERELDEDCLYLNVWTPDVNPTTAAPVLVWIHKGYWNETGSSITAWTDGTHLAEQEGLVVVSFHYRLGALGFLAHPSLGKDSGNYGFLDQVAALEWVRDNIAAFGGDPKRVTIMGGGSQGAEMVGVHLVSPRSKDLFHRAIIHSGVLGTNFQPPSPFAGGPYFSRAEAEAQGQKLAANSFVKCDSATDVAACLRQKTPDELRKALVSFAYQPKLGAGFWAPIVEPGGVLEDTPMALLKAGKLANKVPVLVGANQLEIGGQFEGLEQLDAQALVDRYKSLWGDATATAILTQYPPATTPAMGQCLGPCASAIEMGSDFWFICAARRTARAVTAAGADAYLYHFTYPVWKTLGVPEFAGACHGSIKVYVFNTPQDTPPPPFGWPKWPFSPEEVTMTKEIMGYWARFARTGDPNGGSSATWPKYDAATDKHLELNATFNVGEKLRESYCDFWDALW